MPGTQPVLSARQHRHLVQPEQLGGELVRKGRDHFRVADQVASGDSDFVLQQQCDGLASARAGQVTVGRHDAADLGLAARLDDAHAVTDGNGTCGDGAGKAAKIWPGPVDPLNRKAKGGGGPTIGLQHLQLPQHGGAGVPRHSVGRGPGDVDALQSAERNGRHAHATECRRVPGELITNAVEDTLVVSHEIHLVDCENDVADAEARADRGVPQGLRLQSLPGVDQDHRDIRPGSGRRHVVGELLMPRRVGEDEGTRRSGEIAVGDIDGDALLPLLLQPIRQEGQVDVARPAVALQDCQCVVHDQLALEQQSTDQGRLPVIHRPAGHEAQQGPGRRGQK